MKFSKSVNSRSFLSFLSLNSISSLKFSWSDGSKGSTAELLTTVEGRAYAPKIFLESGKLLVVIAIV